MSTKYPGTFTGSTAVTDWAGLLCFFVAWLFPYAAGGSVDAWQQMFMLAMLTAAALSIGLRAVSGWLTLAVLAACTGILLTENPYWATKTVGLAGLLLFGLACHMGAKLRVKPNLLIAILFAFVAAAMVNAIEGLLQWFGLVGELYRWVIEPEVRGLAFGAFRQRNLFATFLCVGVVCIVWLVYLGRFTQAMAWFLLSVLMLAVAASGSRTGLLESLVLAALALRWRKQLPVPVLRLMFGQVVLLGLSTLFLPVAAGWHGFAFASGASRMAELGQVAQQGLVAQDLRLIIWDNTVQLIAERPWTGWGWRETGYARYITLLDNRLGELLEHAHNLPLQLAAEFGLPVAVAFCGVIAWAIWRAKPWRIEAGGNHFAWVILLLIVGIHSMLEYPLWSAGFLFLAGLWVGYLLPVPYQGQAVPTGQQWALRASYVVGMGLLVLSLIAWQQYAKVLLIYKTPFTNDLVAQRAASTAALAKAEGAWLFQGHLDFSSLGLVQVEVGNAPEVRALAEKLLHHSAEPRVIQPLLLSVWMMNDLVALQFHADRFCRAFPVVFKTWSHQPVPHPMVVEMETISAECKALTLQK